MTTPTAKTIQIYLPTGEPRGIRIAEITTRTVQAVLVPRSDLAQGKLRKELDLPGIYFLFGEDEDGVKPIVYIGQTEDARMRLDSHNKTKAFWKTAILCVSKTQNFTQAHIRYLEWFCMHQVRSVNRYLLDNGQVPGHSPYVPEPMEAELLDVFETVSTLVSTLGYPVFEPVAKQGPASIKFYCRGGGSEGVGELVEDGFVVHEGSKARVEVAPSGASSVNPKREKLIATGILEIRDGSYYFTQDYLFTSPSSAAAVVLGRSANGWMEWKDKDGATLSEVHRDTVDTEDDRESAS